MNQTPPRVFNDLQKWLKDHYVFLPRKLQNVAVFVLNNPGVVAMNTIATISKQANVTPSAMVRFAKSLGYQGFSDMQSVFQESMRHVPQPYTERLHSLDDSRRTGQTELHRFGQAASVSLNRMLKQVDEASILEAGELLAKARTIYIAGQGRAAPVTTYLYYTFVKMGIQAILVNGTEVEMVDKSRLIRSDEAMVAVSFSPYTANTYELVDICLSQQVPVVALTDSTLSPIARSDDLHLVVLEEEVGGIRGLSATMCLALVLAVETGKFMVQKD
ncbi:MAG: MurR/RpiR family transcriptional regulator [Desulfocapsaceae bacterium]